MLDVGDGIGRNLPRARALYEKTCDGGIAADCYALGRARRERRRTTASRPSSLFAKGCAGNVPAACHEVGAGLGRRPRADEGAPLLPEGVRGRVTAACERAKKLAP